jgi:3-hydroxybutyryl-CoA dehydrogenase
MTQEEHDALHSRVTFTSDLGDLAPCQLVVEAVPEHLDLKKELFGKVDAVVSADAILATNTSSLPVTEIAVATKNPKRVVGMHFFNPAPVQQFVEVIRTVITADDVFEDVKALAERLGKKPVVVGDKAGFIANALLFGYLNHAVSMYESKYATREDLDAAMRFGCGYPMGPLALLDLIGLDTAYEILDTMYKQGRDRLHAPSPIIKQMVSAGMLGRKSGRGFYTYEQPGSPQVVADANTPAGGPPAGVTLPGRHGRRGRLGDDGHRHHRGVRQGRVCRDVRRARRRQGRRGAHRDGAKHQARCRAGRLTAEDAEAMLGRVTGATDREALADVDLVVEAIAEDLEIKQELFRDLDRICKPGAILATTTSSLPIIDCAKVTSRPRTSSACTSSTRPRS